MSDVTTEVRATFEEVAAGVPVPRFDEVELRRRVRSARTRRRSGLALAAAAVAGVAALAVVAVPPLLDRGGSGGSAVATAPAPEVTPGLLPGPLYYVAGQRLMAATPDGEVHDLGPFEAVVGSTAEGVLAIGPESEPTWIGASSSDEEDGDFRFERGSGPVRLPSTGPVQSAALSGDGRYFAWLDLGVLVTVYDLKAGKAVDEVAVPPDAYVTSVSASGVLVSEGGELVLHAPPEEVRVPTEADGYGWLSDTEGDLVTVADRDDVTRVYDVTRTGRDGTARLVDSVPGTGRLAPYARGVVSIDGPSVRLWPADGEPVVPGGLDGAPQSAGWLDERYAVVTTAEAGGTALYLCPVDDATCTRVAFSEEDVRLAE